MSPVKLTGMTTVSKMTVLTNLRVLRPVSEAYEKDMEQAQKTLRPEGFDEIEEMVKRHNEAIKNKTEEGKMSKDEIERSNVFYGGYQKDLNEYERKFMDEDLEIEIKTVDTASFDKLVEANDIEAGKLETLMSCLLTA